MSNELPKIEPGMLLEYAAGGSHNGFWLATAKIGDAVSGYYILLANDHDICLSGTSSKLPENIIAVYANSNGTTLAASVIQELMQDDGEETEELRREFKIWSKIPEIVPEGMIEPGDVVEVECPDNDTFCLMVTGLSEDDTGIRVQGYRIRTAHSKRTPTRAVLAESLVVPIDAIFKVWSGCWPDLDEVYEWLWGDGSEPCWERK